MHEKNEHGFFGGSCREKTKKNSVRGFFAGTFKNFQKPENIRHYLRIQVGVVLLVFGIYQIYNEAT